MTAVEDLLGGWDLVEWTATVDGDPAGWPMGRDAQGLLIYAADASMSAVLMRRDRTSFGTTQFPGGADDLRLAAADGYVSYGGWFELDGETVVHHVELALFPDFVGTDLVREVRWDGDRLVLSSVPDTDSKGREIVNELCWQRARIRR